MRNLKLRQFELDTKKETRRTCLGELRMTLHNINIFPYRMNVFTAPYGISAQKKK